MFSFFPRNLFIERKKKKKERKKKIQLGKKNTLVSEPYTYT